MGPSQARPTYQHSLGSDLEAFPSLRFGLVSCVGERESQERVVMRICLRSYAMRRETALTRYSSCAKSRVRRGSPARSPLLDMLTLRNQYVLGKMGGYLLADNRIPLLKEREDIRIQYEAAHKFSRSRSAASTSRRYSAIASFHSGSNGSSRNIPQ